MIVSKCSGFLPLRELSRLVTGVLDEQACFAQARVGLENCDLAPLVRRARLLQGWSDWELKRLFERRIFDVFEKVCQECGIEPFQVARVETEVAVHEDGGFYRRHIDTFTGKYQESEARALSCVLYFYREPKRFSGGHLRLFPLPMTAATSQPLEVEPINNTLVAFPSWYPHEVMKTSVPSRRFEDSRFSINCWLHKTSSRAGT